jgi:hypothetical protein
MKTALFRLKDNIFIAADGIGYITTQYLVDNVYDTFETPKEHIHAMELRGILDYLDEEEIKNFIKDVKDAKKDAEEFNELAGSQPVDNEHLDVRTPHKNRKGK